jgi:hypothetical protein
MAELAVAATVAGTALRATGDIMRGREEARAALFEQDQLKIQEERFRTAASEAEAKRRRELTSQMQTIEAIRAGRGVGAGSPTAIAIVEDVASTGEREINIERTNYLTRAETARRAGEFAGGRAQKSLLAGYLQAGTDIAEGVYQTSRPTKYPASFLGRRI